MRIKPVPQVAGDLFSGRMIELTHVQRQAAIHAEIEAEELEELGIDPNNPEFNFPGDL